MKIEKTIYQTICDTISCNRYSIYSISTYSYKGDINLCEKCFRQLQNTMKRIKDINEAKQ